MPSSPMPGQPAADARRHIHHSLLRNTLVTVLTAPADTVNGWYEVTAKGYTGYIAAGSLKVLPLRKRRCTWRATHPALNRLPARQAISR